MNCFPPAVVMTELVKLIISLVIVFFKESNSFQQFATSLYNIILKNKIDTLKVCVPSLLYVIQNNLLFTAASHLDAATFQVSKTEIQLNTKLYIQLIAN